MLSSCSQKQQLNLDLKLCYMMYFYALHFSIEQIYYAFAGKSDKVFWTRQKEKNFTVAGNWLEHLKTREFLYVHRPKTRNVSTGLGYKFLMGRIHCLHNNIIHRLYAATNQSMSDRKKPMLCLNISQLALILGAILYWAYWLASHHGEISREQGAYFGVQYLDLVYFDETSCA